MKIRVFNAGKGDCLLLTSSDGKNMLVDGGHVFQQFGIDHYSPNVAPFLGQMRDDGEIIDLLCVSHIDQDHIGGVLRMLNDEFKWRVFDFQNSEGLDVEEPENPRPPIIDEIWHNSFHELVSQNRRAIADAIAAAAPMSLAVGIDQVSHGHNLLDDLATSMKEAAQLSRRIGADQLGIPLNATFNNKLVQSRPNQGPVDLGNFRINVIGPTGKQLIALRKEWQAWLRSDKGKRQIRSVRDQAIIDEELLANGQLNEFLLENIGPAIGERNTVTEENVASIVLYVEDGDQDVLLTGDARDDKVIDQLIDSEISDKNGFFHVNVLKIQHHGSENNMSEGFAKRVTADHYIFCGNGEHENPDHRAVRQIINSRLGGPAVKSPNDEASDPFKLWFNADENVEGGEPHIMEELEELVSNEASNSAGQMRFRFTSNRSFSFTP